MIMSLDSCKGMTHEELTTNYHTEVVCSTRWIVSFIFLQSIQKHGRSADKRDKAEQVLRSFLGIAGEPKSLALCIDTSHLTDCTSSMLTDSGCCGHVLKVVQNMACMYGSSWQISSPIAFLQEAYTHPQCESLRRWMAIVVKELCQTIDEFVLANGASLASAAGMPVLVSPVKNCRAMRLTSIMRATPGLRISKGDGITPTFVQSGLRCLIASEAERSQMGVYLEKGAQTFHDCQQYGLSVDCSGVSGREQLSLGLCAHESALDGKEFAMWLPVQDCTQLKGFIALFPVF